MYLSLRGLLMKNICCNERMSSVFPNLTNRRKVLQLSLITLCVSGNIFLLYYFKFAVKSADFIRTIPGCHNCYRHKSASSPSNMNYCTSNQSVATISPELLIFVLCKTNDDKSREIIRQTWGSREEQLAGNFRVVFVVGKDQPAKLTSERSTYGDILQVDATENYRKLTEKVTQALVWFHHECQNIKYVFKTDTDVFINVPYILRIIRRYYSKNTIVGHCFESYEKPDRRKKSKWFVSEEEYSGSNYPPYCSGSGYLMDRSTVAKLSKVFQDTPMFPMEDVYMGFCAYKTNVKVVDVTGFHLVPVGYDEFRYCHCLSVVHKLNSGKQREIWRRHELYCGSRWSQSSGYPVTCYLMTSHYVMKIFLVVGIIIGVILGIVFCCKHPSKH